MKLEIKINSSEMVTPSSPTPHHLKHHRLSFLDQIMAPLLTPAYFFYPANNENNVITAPQLRSFHLKKSLSQALTLFYPLAGRLVGNSHVNCNDEGVLYVEAHATNNMLSDVITDPIPEEFSKLFPCDPDDPKDHCMVVQTTFFCCGGLALGFGMAHKVVDGLTYFIFLNTWASFSRGDRLIKSPKFQSAILFPPKNLVREIVLLEKKENMVTKRFVFCPQKITGLRDKLYTNNTRIQALTAFIGNRFMVATRAKDTSKVYALRIFVDIRTRVVPPLSKYHFGSTVIPATITLPSLGKGEDCINDIVTKLRDAIHSVDGNFAAKLRQENDSSLSNLESEGVVMLTFTNFCSLPVNEANFGWGIPTVIGGPNIPVNNVVFYSNSLSVRGGIDAWVNLKEEDMIKFEADKELLKYVSHADGTNFLSKM